MKKIYEKNELNFALMWIGIYVVSMVVGENVSGAIGIKKIVTTPICLILALTIYLWVNKNGLKEKYGLCTFKASVTKYLFFIPLVFIASVNLWNGLQMTITVGEAFLHVISMLCVGFVEEMIFRGFLFQAICKTSVKQAIVISSVTFGLGHITNLLTGREILATLLQLCYAAAIGFLFTIVLYKGKSIWPCIITHGVLNSLSAFVNTENVTMQSSIISSIILCIVSLAYAIYIIYISKEKNEAVA